jgi:protein-S-isoprenylcysteine O-methyltransferase Ste14
MPAALSPIWILIAMALYGLQHSFLASLGFKNRLKDRLGAGFMDRYYRLVFNVLGGVTLVPVLLIVFILPDSPIYAVPPPWSLLFRFGQLASALVVALSVVRTGAMDFLGLRQAADPDASPPRLVTDGLYGWVRHPLYTFSILFLWLNPVMTWNWAAFSLGSTLYFYVGAIYEERKLAAHYGEAYEAYRARTPMLVPGIRLSKQKEK